MWRWLKSFLMEDKELCILHCKIKAAADDLVVQGVRASAAMLLTNFLIIPTWAPDGLIDVISSSGLSVWCVGGKYDYHILNHLGEKVYVETRIFWNLFKISSVNGLSPVWHQDIDWLCWMLIEQ